MPEPTSKPVYTRTITCPVCETVVRCVIPKARRGVETYTLPLHPPTLPVNACLGMRVRVQLGPFIYTTREALAQAPQSVPRAHDARTEEFRQRVAVDGFMAAVDARRNG